MSSSDPTTPTNLTNGRNNIQEMEDALKNLRNVTEEDKTEIGMLRGRLEDQSEMIAELKKTADAVSARKDELEKLIDELGSYKQTAADQLEEEQKKYFMMESSFNELASKHEGMIKFKDDCKRQNDQLRKENSLLKAENEKRINDAMLSRDQEISQVEVESRQLRDLVLKQRQENSAMKKKLEEELRAEKTKLTSIEKGSEQQVRDLTQKMKSATEEKQQLQTKLKANSELREKLLDEMRRNQVSLVKERDEMKELASHRAQLMKEKDAELKLLEKRVKDSEDRLAQVQQQYEEEADTVSIGARTRSLRAEYSQGLDGYEQLSKQFEAFKKHSSTMLAKEKELNARLQKLNS